MTIRSHSIMAVLLAAAAAAATACGGGQKPADTTSLEESGGGEEPSRADPGGGAMVLPETMDDIQRRFDRKRSSVSRCLSAAVDAKELPRTARGKITLNVVINPGGKAGEVKVARATLESPMLTECVIAKVREIIFPEVPQPFPTSYTYGFEAM
ncbi:MAG TPA: AgmX/PglI C-terminal domain-containing protein [Kofleriaceae bacterium]|nr:AgmX/PglI C-terminal domain-containing protein [Kofleriaceae bacterium]